VSAPGSVQYPAAAAANSPSPTPDLGRKPENAVLIALRRMGASPTFAAAPHEWECDFVTTELAIQCCPRLTPGNLQRELRGLIQAFSLPGSTRRRGRELLFVTLDQEDSLKEKGHEIRVIPAWKWLDKGRPAGIRIQDTVLSDFGRPKRSSLFRNSIAQNGHHHSNGQNELGGGGVIFEVKLLRLRGHSSVISSMLKMCPLHGTEGDTYRKNHSK
jgi:hypothetical protein